MAASISEGGRILDVNDLFQDRLGYTRAEMIDREPTEFMTAASARRIIEEFRPALRRTGRLDNKPVSFVSKTGEVIAA